MSHEISQLDLADRQLLSKSKATVWTDIGEAEITHTIFGKAKVRITRKQDKMRSTLLLAAVVSIVVIVAAWQSWIALQQTEPQQSTEAVSPVSPPVEVIMPTSQLEYTLHPAAPQLLKIKPDTPLPIVTPDSPISQRSTPPQTLLLKPEEKTAKPELKQSSVSAQPDKLPLASSTVPYNSQTGKPLASREFPQKRLAASAVPATPNAEAVVTGSPAIVAPAARDMPVPQLPVGDKSLMDPINVQSK